MELEKSTKVELPMNFKQRRIVITISKCENANSTPLIDEFNGNMDSVKSEVISDSLVTYLIRNSSFVTSGN